MLAPRRLAAPAAASLAFALAALLPGAGRADPPPHVSIVSDSVLTAVTWGNDAAQAALTQGLDVAIDAGVCRRLNGESCEFAGGHVPTTLQVLAGWGYLGPVVVIVDGYNDIPASFTGDVELTLDTLRDRGVQHVLWVNLHAVKQEFVDKNAVLAAAARHHPELRVLDWNGYSSPHADWYQTDGIHLLPGGGIAIATWLHQAIEGALAPAPPPRAARTLAAAHNRTLVVRAGRRVTRRLHAVGGVGPLRWLAKGRALHRVKLHLLARGELEGRPTRPGRYRLPLQVVDATGAVARVTIRVTVRR
ncbi:MAG TPA: hypothetical protein VFU56_03130 [Gaiellaceae bacterium]|nr:hypothetical protein [Gaiellaceae bacterium]